MGVIIGAVIALSVQIAGVRTDLRRMDDRLRAVVVEFGNRSLFPMGGGVRRREAPQTGRDRNQAGTALTGRDSRPRSTMPRRNAGRFASSRNDE